WQPRIADAVGEQAPRPRGGGGALQHDGVAGHERRGGRAARERERKVERRDDHPRPVGLEHATVVRGVRGERVVGERAVEGAAALAAGNSPSTWAESAGFVLTKCRCAGRSRPAMKSGWRPPRRSRARSTADSKRACSSGGGSNIVA